MKHFMLVFDRSDGRVLREEEFADARAAMKERFAAERLHRGNANIEVVVLGAADADSLRVTHSRYFQDVASLTRRGAEIVKSHRIASSGR